MATTQKTAAVALAASTTTDTLLLANDSTSQRIAVIGIIVTPSTNDLSSYDATANQVDIGQRISESSAATRWLVRQFEPQLGVMNVPVRGVVVLGVSDGTDHPSLRVRRIGTSGVALDILVQYLEID